MKIISKYKDYYDHVAHMYGGGDEKIIYERKRLGVMTRHSDMFIVADVKVSTSGSLELRMPYHYAETRFNSSWRETRWLVVCGKAFPLVNNPPNQESVAVYKDNWEVFSFEKHRHLLVARDQVEPKKGYVPGIEQKDLIELSRLVGHPVFIIKATTNYRQKNTVTIDGNCPVLAEMGLAPLYPAEQLYQDLSYFLANKMQDSPDVAKPANMTDKERVVQHGFDIKKSFRHRV